MSNSTPRWGPDQERFVDEMLAWLAAMGTTRYDENVTQLEHALQSAALARKRELPDALVIGALLHDVGHLIAGEHLDNDDFLDNDLEHENIGAFWLARGFGPEVTEPIRLHVDAKRYLCGDEAAYRHGLSESSRRSLIVQGGPMDAEELDWFKALPHAQAAIALRRIDDTAKRAGLKVAPVGEYRQTILALLAQGPTWRIAAGRAGS